MAWAEAGYHAVAPDQRGYGGTDRPAAVDAYTNADLDTYARDFERTGFAEPLNWYRNIDRNWRLMAPWQGARLTPPALYIGGDRDIVYHFPGAQKAAADLRTWVPNLSGTLILQGCGHWTQQERPTAVNQALLAFLAGI